MHTGLTNDDNDLGDDIFSTIGGAGSRAKNCLTQIKTFFPTAEHDMFVAHYISPEEKNSTKQMFRGLKDSFHKLIEETEWMTTRTKRKAQKKLRNGLDVECRRGWLWHTCEWWRHLRSREGHVRSLSEGKTFFNPQFLCQQRVVTCSASTTQCENVMQEVCQQVPYRVRPPPD